MTDSSAADVSGDDSAKMMWTTTCYGRPTITYRYDVALLDWPHNITFDSPSRHSSIKQLTTLIERFESGATRFVKLTEDEMELLAEEEQSSLRARRMECGRVDVGKRPARRPETRSKRLRFRTVKTDRLIFAREDWI